jgi:hypothetical protein
MSNIIPMTSRQPNKLSRQEFKNRVVALANAGAVKVSIHLNRDHPERKISQSQIELCLIKGTVQSDPYINKFGNWQSEIFRHMAGHELVVVAVLEWERQVVVVTAYEP